MSQEPAKPPAPLVSPGIAPAPHQTTAETAVPATCTEQAFANEVGTEALLLGTASTYRAKRKGFSWPCLGWPAALLRAGVLQPASLPTAHIPGG